MSPGDSINGLAGSLTINGKTTLDAGSRFLVMLNGTDDFTRLMALGGLEISSDAELVVTLGLAPGLDSVYEIASTGNGGVTGAFKGLGDGDEMTVDNVLFRVNYTDKVVTLTTLGVIPEPATAAFLALAGCFSLSRLRRRK